VIIAFAHPSTGNSRSSAREVLRYFVGRSILPGIFTPKLDLRLFPRRTGPGRALRTSPLYFALMRM
jgi:hypothetical protein